jgi:hypothetical protein
LIQKWTRDDGWEITVTLEEGSDICTLSHHPMSTNPLVPPVRYCHAVSVMMAHGYECTYNEAIKDE